MRKIYVALLGLLFVCSAFAGSTVNPSIPAQNSALTSSPLRSNFMAAYSDINNILGQFAGTSAPPSPSRFQYWLDTSTDPAILKIYDGVSWVQTAKLNTATHAWAPVGSYAGTPISTTYGGTGADLHTSTGAVSMSSGVTSVGTLPSSYLAAPLTALAAYNTNGLLTQTAANTFTGRTLTGTAAEITLTNGDGVSGNPVVSLPSALTFTGKTVTGGTFSSPTLTTPIISSIVNTGTLTLPTSTDTLIGKATADTLTNKTYDTAGTGNSFSINGLAATANTGTGAVVRATSPTLVTPVLGVATATSINGNTITTGTGTLTLAAGKTHTVNNSIALSGTDSTTMTFPTTSATVARTDAAQTFTGAQTFSSTIVGSVNGNAATVTTNANLTGPITSVGNATSVASQTGTGSKFVMDTSPTLVTPVLGVATATSINFGGTALSNYSEGTFTPVFTCGTPGNLAIVYSTQAGTYTRVGRKVTVTIQIAVSSFTWTTSSGIVSISGLPFTAVTASMSPVGAFQGFTSAGYTQLGGQFSGTTSVYIVKSGSGQTFANSTIADFPSGGNVQLYMTLTYFI